MEVKEYRSPQYKLVQFFERSRNNWKRKCQDRIVRMKRLASRLEKMRSGRDRWRERAQSLEEELSRVQEELQQLKLGG
jgi:predicted nuclease with TOPRIM domain